MPRFSQIAFSPIKNAISLSKLPPSMNGGFRAWFPGQPTAAEGAGIGERLRVRFYFQLGQCAEILTTRTHDGPFSLAGI